MDDIRFGMVVRSARVSRRWRQRDLAGDAGVSDATVSRIERGHLDGVSLGTIRRIALGLDIRVELVPKSRSANLDRIVHARHAQLGEAVIRWIGTFGGLIVRPEVSYSRFGERGVVDLLAWHPGRRALLVIELKTAIIDVGELLGTLDRKVRNAREIALGLGWDPETIARALIVAEGPTNRRRIQAHAATFGASLPDRIVELRSWLKEPGSPVRAPGTQLRALAFFAVRHDGQVVQRFDHRERVSCSGRRAKGKRRAKAEHDRMGQPASAAP